MTQVRMPARLTAVIMVVVFVTLGCAGPVATLTPEEDPGHVAEEEADHDEGDEGAHEETEEADHEDVTLSAAALRGQEVFNTVGCMACHGQNAEGTAIAPALAGHTEAQVRRQTRAPVGMMPVFPPDKVSDVQLGDLVAYITALGEGHAHQREGGDIGVEMQMHHWMALFAIEDGGIDEGRHHVQHIIDLTQGDHRARMQGVLAELEAGGTHDAVHTIEEMLAGVLDDGTSGETMHLRLALSSVRIRDADGAVHHMEHFLEVAGATGHEVGEAIMALVQAGDLTAAEHELGELLEALGAAAADEPAHEKEMEMGGTPHEEETPTP